MTAPIAPGRAPLPLPIFDSRGEPLSRPVNRMAPGAHDPRVATPDRRAPIVDKTQVDPQIRRAAEGMEAMFIDYMLKVMRQTVPKSEMDLESPASGIYRSMLDSETAERAARAGGVGLADQIIAYLQPQRYTQSREPNQSTGGTDEGRPDKK